MFKVLLVACDGSDSASKAFDYALDMAKKFDARVFGLSVIHVPDFGGQVEAAALVESAQTHYQAMADQLALRASEAGVPFQFETKAGHPAERIVACAQARGADLIVMGHRGKSLIERWLTGSTTKQVMGYAHCPVLIVR